MFDGMVQGLTTEGQRLSVTRFADFTYDLSGLIGVNTREGRGVAELATYDLLHPTEALMAETKSNRATFLHDGHMRFSEPLLATVAAMIGFATLLLGAFSRFGLWRQILVAVVLLVVVQAINTAANAAAMKSDQAWALVYTAPVIGAGMAFGIIWLSQRPRQMRRRAGQMRQVAA
jgi:lipopolysaccharide export system permease protein